MVENLQKLYNTMMLVETKGESTKIMGECLKFTEQLINEERTREQDISEPKQTVQ